MRQNEKLVDGTKNPQSSGGLCAESQNRTDDTAIFSRVLYQLSYLGMHSSAEMRGNFTRTAIPCQASQVFAQPIRVQRVNAGYGIEFTPYLVNFLCAQLSYQRTAYMKTTGQIPKKTILRSKQKNHTDKCQCRG
jgi:hypothetical protein